MSSQPDLSSLRIDRDPPTPRRGLPAWVLAILILAGVAVSVFVGLRVMRANGGVVVTTGTAEATGGGTASGAGISANGYVVARTKASVSSKILGRLAWVGITEGSHVRTGDIIARLESMDYEAALHAAEATGAQLDAQTVQAQRDLKRAQSLRAQDLLSESELENAQTKLEVATAQANAGRAQVKLAQANLENTRVRAPFTGTVLRKDAEVGEIVAPSSAGGGLTRTAIVTMADLSTLEVEVDVNEADRQCPAVAHHARRLPGHVVQRPCAPGRAHRRPAEGHRAGQGLHPRSRPAHPARDGCEGGVRGA
jgi:multidrug efflux pump subunit AcrA (membrane-fusion protein)